MQLVEFNRKDGMKMVQSLLRHCINNALYQTKLPLFNALHGANKMCPHGLLHTLDVRLTIYMQEALQGLMSGGSSRDTWMHSTSKCTTQSDNKVRGIFLVAQFAVGWLTVRVANHQSKKVISSYLCFLHMSDGAFILKQELNFVPSHWETWLNFLKLYLSMEEWFHDSRPKDEVHCASNAIEAVIKPVQLFFPRGKDSHGYNIPKMHGLTKMRDYICEFGSAKYFYGGPRHLWRQRGWKLNVGWRNFWLRQQFRITTLCLWIRLSKIWDLK